MQNVLAKLRGIRHIEMYLVILAVAVFILVWYKGAEAPDAVRQSGGTQLERRMEEVLSTVAGAGQVRVLVSTAEKTAAVFAQDTGPEPVRGVVVVAEGADDLGVSLQLQRAVMALLDVPAENVEVLKMHGGMLE